MESDGAVNQHSREYDLLEQPTANRANAIAKRL